MCCILGMKAPGVEKNLNLGSEDNITILVSQTCGGTEPSHPSLDASLGCWVLIRERRLEYCLGTTLDVKSYHSNSFGTPGPKRASVRLEICES